MAESYKDITGPVVALITSIAKEGRAEEVAEYLAKALADQVRDAKEGKLPGYESLECTRYENKFIVLERFAGIESCERILATKFAKHTRVLGNLVDDPPEIQFFPADGLGVPRYIAATTTK